MWYRSLSVAVVCTLAASQSVWAQPPNRGGRNQDEAIRKLEQEMTQLKGEIKKLQEAQKQSSERRAGPGSSAQSDRRGGPPASADRRRGLGGPGGPPPMADRRRGPDGPPAFADRRSGPGGFGGPRGQMAFQGEQFGPRGWNQWQGPQGFGPNRFQGRGFDPRWNGAPRQFSQRGAWGAPGFQQQRWQQPRRGEFRAPARNERGESFRGRQGERPSQPPRSRQGDERRDERPRPERRPAA